MRRAPLLLAALAILASPLVADGDCEYTETREAVLDGAGAEKLTIDARAGSLRVIGRPGASEVTVRGTACASHQEDLEDIRLETRANGGKLRVAVDIPDSGWTWKRTARLDLEVEVPVELAVEVSDSSGSIEISGTAGVEVDDGSGEIEIRDVSGDVRITDGSGGIDIQDVQGSVFIEEDGSGEIGIDGVGRDVEIREDGSGGITIERVEGNVRIREDGSGGIRVARVGGDFTVVRDGSGGISFDDVSGRVEVP